MSLIPSSIPRAHRLNCVILRVIYASLHSLSTSRQRSYTHTHTHSLSLVSLPLNHNSQLTRLRIKLSQKPPVSFNGDSKRWRKQRTIAAVAAQKPYSDCSSFLNAHFGLPSLAAHAQLNGAAAWPHWLVSCPLRVSYFTAATKRNGFID